MFGPIKVIVDLISFSLKDGLSFKDKVQRRTDVLRMLETYFLLKDCLDEGYALVEEAGSNPVEKIREMPVPQAEELVRRWDYILRKQGRRLVLLQDYLLGQDHLTVINPDLQKKILEAIGSKWARVRTLRGIGAALFFYNIFPLAENPEEKARYILVMLGSRRQTISMSTIKREIEGLSESLVQYRQTIEKLISSEEVVHLSKQARKKTLFPALPVSRDLSKDRSSISAANTDTSRLAGSRGNSTKSQSIERDSN